MRGHRDFLATHDTAILEPDARLEIFIREYRAYRDAAGDPLRLLDVGCGKRPVLARHVDDRDEYWGCDFYDPADVDLPNYVRVDLNEASLLDDDDGPSSTKRASWTTMTVRSTSSSAAR